MPRLPLLSLMLLCSVAPVAAQTAPSRAEDSAAVLVVAEQVMRAISTRDTALARRVLLPGAQFVAIPDPAPATVAARVTTEADFLARLATTPQRYLERIWSPTVVLQGSIAVVHAPYDFHVDGTFSHCGVDTLTMIRTRGEWRISHLAYTTQRTGCAPSPLGPPR